jgi:hypothetical protein
LVRSSSAETAGVSSMNNSVSESTPAASISIGHSSSPISPRRSFCWLMPVSDESRRCTNCSLLISRLKKATRWP